MFIPSMFKSTPQLISGAIVGSNTISSVNKDYTRLSVPGFKSKAESGFVSFQQYRIKLTSNTNLEVYALAPAPITPPATIDVWVEEYLPLFFRQAFHWDDVVIADQQLSGTVNTGKTFGPKAFPVYLGSVANWIVSPSGLALAEAQVNCKLDLNAGTGVVTATRDEANYSDTVGTLTSSFIIIDPK